MTDKKLRGSLVLGLIVLWSLPAAAVRDVPGVADSSRVRLTLPETHFGAATSWMVGSTLLEQGDLSGALPYLMQAWRMSPGEKEMGLVCRDVLFELGYGADAMEVSQRLVTDHGRDADDGASIRERHAGILVALERYTEALSGVRELRTEYPDSLRYQHMEAEILLRADRLDAAAELYRNLREHDPDQAPGLTVTLAEIAERAGDPAASRRLWHEALQQWPEDANLRTAWIRFALERQWDEEALTAAQDAPGQGPHSGVTWVTMTAGLLVGEGREPVAHDWLLAQAQAGALGPDDTVFLCRLLAARDDGPAALNLLDSGVNSWPDHARIRMFQAEFLAAADRLEEAEVAARRALALDHQDPDIPFSLLTILSRGHPEAFAPPPRTERGEAVRNEILALATTIEEIDEIMPAPSHMLLGGTYQALTLPARAEPHFLAAAESPEFLRDAMLSLSLVYEDLGRDEDLLAALERLHQAHADDPVAQNALGYSLADLDRDLERAERLIRQALVSQPENPAFLDSLGWVLYRSGNAVDAFDYLVRAVNALPDDPVILEHLARVLHTLGQHERAEATARRALAAGADPAAIQDLLPEGQ